MAHAAPAAPVPSPLPALILAAGRGERMRPLTDTCPKPLLVVRGRPLIEWHLDALARAGVREVVINTAWLEEQFPAVLGDGSRFGLAIRYSFEGRDHGGALETAGGIATALPLLRRTARDAFWVVGGDVWLPGFVFDADTGASFAAGDALAHLWLVPNAAHHARGDFAIAPDGRLLADGQAERLTWASVGLFRASMFEPVAPGTRLPLRPLLDASIAAGHITGERWDGGWTDVGTPERWAALQ